MIEKINQSLKQSNVLVLVSNATTCFQLIDLVKFGKDAYCSKLSNSIILKNKNQTEVLLKDHEKACSLWDMDNVIFFDDKFFETVFYY